MIKRAARFNKIASGLLGAILLFATGCRDKDKAGDWAGNVPAVPEAPAPAPAVQPVAAAVESPKPPVARYHAEVSTGVRFVAYNVENWLTMDRYVDGRSQKGAPKPAKERKAIAEVLVSARPDVLGVSEVGNEDDVRDLQRHLEEAGHPMLYFHLNRGADPTRSLVLLSRFPIGKTVARDDLHYRLQGREYPMQRGILDASVVTPAGEFRFLGVHLKSKRDTEDGDQEGMRLNEAHLLRREIDGILGESPQARLVVYGDFNDTRQSPTLRAVRGSGKNDKTLLMIALKDSRGEYWTHHWDFQDVYSRIDYVLVSNPLRHSIEWDHCRIIDDPAVPGASDHRPLLVILK